MWVCAHEYSTTVLLGPRRGQQTLELELEAVMSQSGSLEEQ